MNSQYCLLLFLTLITVRNAQFDNIRPCVICDDHWFVVPTNWDTMSKYLRGGCNRLDKDVIWPCRDLVDSMNLWEQYRTIYPYIVDLHKQACSVFCSRG